MCSSLTPSPSLAGGRQAGLGFALALVVALALSGCGPAIYQWQYDTYTVRPGDTLYGIAFDHDLDFHQLARWNHIDTPYTIYTGQTLRLTPPGGSASQPPKVATIPGKRPSPSPRSPAPQPAGNTAPVASAPTGHENVKLTGDWVWPVKGPLLSLAMPALAPHGLNIGGHLGESIHAAAAGHVVYSGGGLKGYGLLIIIKHNEHYLSAYAHNSKLEVAEGDQVRSGQEIARMGLGPQQTPMLHFEIRRDGQPIDPRRLLPPLKRP